MRMRMRRRKWRSAERGSVRGKRKRESENRARDAQREHAEHSCVTRTRARASLAAYCGVYVRGCMQISKVAKGHLRLIVPDRACGPNRISLDRMTNPPGPVVIRRGACISRCAVKVAADEPALFDIERIRISGSPRPVTLLFAFSSVNTKQDYASGKESTALCNRDGIRRLFEKLFFFLDTEVRVIGVIQVSRI